MRKAVPVFLVLSGSAASAVRSDEPQPIVFSINGTQLGPVGAVGGGGVFRLRAMRAAFESGRFEQCAIESSKAKKMAKGLEPWIVNLELQCSLQAAKASPPNKVVVDRLAQVLDAIDSRPNWLALGAHSDRLRGNYLQGRLVALELDTKLNRSRAWRHLDRAIGVGLSGFDEANRGRLWRLAGELAFVQQKTDAAKDFFKRSLGEQDQPELRDRLRSLDPAVPRDESVPQLVQPKTPDGSEAELELFDGINRALKTGDLVAAVADAVKLLRDFSGSSRTRWASDRVFETLISVVDRVSDKSSDKFVPVRNSVLKEMEKSDPERLGEWVRLLYNRGYWAEAAELSRVLALSGNGPRPTKQIELALEALYAVEDWTAVRKVAEILIERHSGTASSRLAMFRLGLLAYREGDDVKAEQWFEKVLMGSISEGVEIQTRYWLWRALSRSKSDRAAQHAEELLRRFPFSYYGLRVRLQTNGGKLEWSKETPKLDVKHWLMGEEKLAWDRAQILIGAGWFDEAQDELKLLPPAQSPEAKAVRARLLWSAKSFPAAARLANQAWDGKPELRRIDVIKTAFPEEYREYFESAAKTKGLDPLLTRSLTKQESSFNPRAVSSSNAMGLMQMIPPTAKEIADDLKLGKLILPDDMFDPKRNIPMGTHYLAKMLNTFKGHVPLALAAYNAGPTRLDRWLKVRASLQGLETTRTSAPEFEVWIDELPYSETSFYVKAILRNALLYRMLEDGGVDAREPLWKGFSNIARP